MRVWFLPHAVAITHAEDPRDGDWAFCGRKLVDKETGDHLAKPVSRGHVSCPDCVELIEYCRAMPKDWKQRVKGKIDG